jgi:hypothetical protein
MAATIAAFGVDSNCLALGDRNRPSIHICSSTASAQAGHALKCASNATAAHGGKSRFK